LIELLTPRTVEVAEAPEKGKKGEVKGASAAPKQAKAPTAKPKKAAAAKKPVKKAAKKAKAGA
jgi:hypothetical protein